MEIHGCKDFFLRILSAKIFAWQGWLSAEYMSTVTEVTLKNFICFHLEKITQSQKFTYPESNKDDCTEQVWNQNDSHKTLCLHVQKYMFSITAWSLGGCNVIYHQWQAFTSLCGFYMAQNASELQEKYKEVAVKYNKE